MNTKAFLSVLLPNVDPLLLIYLAYWRRKVAAFWSAVSLGVLFSLLNIFLGVVTRGFVIESDIVRERYGPTLCSFYQSWYFVYFHLVVFLGFIYLIIWRRQHLN